MILNSFPILDSLDPQLDGFISCLHVEHLALATRDVWDVIYYCPIQFP